MVGSKKGGFTLIELVFAIVVLSVVVISIPLISRVNVHNMQKALVQEAIYATSTKLGNLGAYAYDTASLDEHGFEGIICNGATPSGLINQPFHRRCTDNTVSDGSILTLDDVATSGTLLEADIDNDGRGYKNEYSYALDIDNTNPDIKKITATIKLEDEEVVVLKTFVANIGEVEFYKRSF